MDVENLMIKQLQRERRYVFQLEPFEYWDGPHLLEEVTREHDFEFPEEQCLSYSNPIVGFLHKPGRSGMQIVMSDGAISDLPDAK